MKNDKEPSHRALDRGFARIMEAVVNADERERERLLRIADSADRAHDAYARIVKPAQQGNDAVQLLRLADSYIAVGRLDLDHRRATPAAGESPGMADPDDAQRAADPPAMAVITMGDGPTERPDEVDAVELSQVHADDEFLDTLGGNRPDSVPDDRLSLLLASWRRDVESEPIGELVDSKLATVTVMAARARARRRPRLLVPLAAAAVAIAIAFAGVGLAAREAQPGDTLWSLTKVLYVDYARSVEAAEAVRSDLNRARDALVRGNTDNARSFLGEARQALRNVTESDDQSDLHTQLVNLEETLSNNGTTEGSAPTTSGTP